MVLSVVHVTPFFHPATQYGGPVAQLALLCPWLAGRGHRVRVVTTDLGIGPKLPRDAWVQKDGYEVWYSHVGRMAAAAPHYAPALHGPLSACLKDAQILHMSLGLTLINHLARRLAQIRGVPYVYTPHGVLCPTRLRDRRLAKAVFLSTVERKIIQDAAMLQALTSKETNDLLAQGAWTQRIRVIANPVDMGDPVQWPSRQDSRAALGVPQGAVAVLFLGQLLKVKGLDLLIQALARVRGTGQEVQLLVAGPDRGFENEARALTDKLGMGRWVQWMGHVDGQVRLQAFRAADIFALTSHSEGLPMSVLEACAMGLPTLLTQACNLPEVARRQAGRVVDPVVQPIAAALAEMAADGALRQRMAANARALALDLFTPQRVGEQIETMYQAALTL